MSDTDAAFWAADHQVLREYVSKLCHVVENAKALVTQNLRMAQPHLLRLVYSHVLILLDDIRLVPTGSALRGPQTWDLAHLLDVMAVNHLAVASPRVRGQSKGGGQKFRDVMDKEPPVGTEGTVSEFMEIYVYLMTADAWELLWTLLHTPTNPFAWGYDMWLPKFCRQAFEAHGNVYKQGIVSSLRTEHFQGDVRADNSGTKAKWQGVLAQEKFYRKYLDIDLRHFRSSKERSEGSLASPSAEYLSYLQARRREQMWIPAHTALSTAFPIYGSRQRHVPGAEEDGSEAQQQREVPSSPLAAVSARGLLLAPSMSSAEQAQTMVHNLERLGGHMAPSGSWDCVIYVNVERGKGDIWTAKAFALLRESCFVIEEPGGGLAHALLATQPCFLGSAYSHVFVLQAGMRLIEDRDNLSNSQPQPRWNLQNLLDVMSFNDMSVAAPAIDGELEFGQGELLLSHDQRSALAGVMAIAPDNKHDGVESAYVELSAVLFTTEAFKALWDLAHPASNPSGQGLALWYDQYCRSVRRAKAHRMGVVSSSRVSRGNSVGSEHIALLAQAKAQEALYLDSWAIPLEQYRNALELSKLTLSILSKTSSKPRWQFSASVTRKQQMSIFPAAARAGRNGPEAAKRAYDQK